MAAEAAALRRRRFDAGRGPTLGEVGEERLVAELVAVARAATAPGMPEMLVPAGDDAAAWLPPPGEAVVLTQDAVVEGEDFRRAWTAPWQLGRRALAVALSDLAATGATAVACTATLCAPASLRLDDAVAIQLGLCELAAELGCVPAGGDVSRIAGPLVIDVACCGSVDPARTLRRGAGRAGDRLAVTGRLGRAAAGLRLLDRRAPGGGPEPAAARAWRAAHLQPSPRLLEGRRLAGGGARCGCDLSDGLLADLARLAQASGLGADVDVGALPVDAELRERWPDAWVDLATGGGDDYELLVAAPEATLGRLVAGWPSHLAPLAVIGRLRPGGGVRLLDAGRKLAPGPVRSRHFA